VLLFGCNYLWEVVACTTVSAASVLGEALDRQEEFQNSSTDGIAELAGFFSVLLPSSRCTCAVLS
jgi:hypothetical protein